MKKYLTYKCAYALHKHSFKDALEDIKETESWPVVIKNHGWTKHNLINSLDTFLNMRTIYHRYVEQEENKWMPSIIHGGQNKLAAY